ncbi:MAG: xylulokinase [Lachnospiraceae bacterium]|nr:xylulokinase [Lachnospiraceae bacterium]
MYYVGIDLGTSAVKLVLMNEGGQVISTVSEEYKVDFPHVGWSEQNPEDWFLMTIKGLKELLSKDEMKYVRAMGIAGQMHGLVVLDENDNVIRPAILWNDGRSILETRFLNEEFGVENLGKETGNIAFAGFTAPKILWMKKHEEENFKKIRKIMLPKDYLVYRMTGEFSTDASDACGMLLMDVKNRCYSDKMLNICGVEKSMLPKIHESYETVGELKSDIKELIGFDSNQRIIMAAGAGDNAAAAVGTGVISGVDGNKTEENCNCNISLGTSGTIFIANKDYVDVKGHSLHSFAHSDGTYTLLGCMLSAASCNKWWMDDILKTTDYKHEQSFIKDEMLGENNVYFLPYLMGERCPHNDPKVRGGFFGLSMDTSREAITQAILEGVCFGIRDSIELAKNAGVEVNISRICGGGAKSELWRRMMAAVLKIPLQQVECEEGPGFGGAILAAVADGLYQSVDEAVSKVVKVSEVTECDMKLASKYEEKYQKYRKLYPMIKEFYN